MSKKTTKVKHDDLKSTVRQSHNSDVSKAIWVFDMLDNSEEFAFNVQRISENGHLELIFSKMIEYTNLTWAEIKKQTHDRSNKSKHHLLDYAGLSKEAAARINKLKLEEYTDSIFSFALQNKVRIIGIRINEIFHVVWYDAEHKFYPGKKK